jgi:hypothetical protein
MPHYQVKITNVTVLQVETVIEADNPQEAFHKAEEKLAAETITLLPLIDHLQIGPVDQLD